MAKKFFKYCSSCMKKFIPTGRKAVYCPTCRYRIQFTESKRAGKKKLPYYLR